MNNEELFKILDEGNFNVEKDDNNDRIKLVFTTSFGFKTDIISDISLYTSNIELCEEYFKLKKNEITDEDIEDLEYYSEWR
jgi:hypothetical protein